MGGNGQLCRSMGLACPSAAVARRSRRSPVSQKSVDCFSQSPASFHYSETPRLGEPLPAWQGSWGCMSLLVQKTMNRQGSGSLLPVFAPSRTDLTSTPGVSVNEGEDMVNNHTPQLLRVSDICRLLQISRASLYRKVDSGEFVRPIYLGARMPRWDSDQLYAWIAAKTQV